MEIVLSYGGHVRLPKPLLSSSTTTTTTAEPAYDVQELVQGAHAVFTANPASAPLSARAWPATMTADVVAPLRQLLLRERGIVMVRLDMAQCVAAVASDTTVYLLLQEDQPKARVKTAASLTCHRLLLRYYADVDQLLPAIQPLVATADELSGKARRGLLHKKRRATADAKSLAVSASVSPSTSPVGSPVGSPATPSATGRRSTLAALFGRIRRASSGDQPATAPGSHEDHEDDDQPAPLSPSGSPNLPSRLARRHTRGMAQRRASPLVQRQRQDSSQDEPIYDVRTMAGLSAASTLSLDSGCGVDSPSNLSSRRTTASSTGLGGLSSTVSLGLSRSLMALSTTTTDADSDDTDVDDVPVGMDWLDEYDDVPATPRRNMASERSPVQATGATVAELERRFNALPGGAVSTSLMNLSSDAVVPAAIGQALTAVATGGASQQGQTSQSCETLLGQEAADDEGFDLDDNVLRMAELKALQELRRQPYYHGYLSWEEAVKRLDHFGQAGAFLVRASGRDEQEFIVSVMNENLRVSHLCVLQVSGRMHITGHVAARFFSVPELVGHHVNKQTKLAGCVLRTPVPAPQ